MKQWLIGALVAVVAATSVPNVAEAKRFGGGGFSGMQRNMPAKTAPNAPPPKPATPAQPQQAAPANAAAAGAAPAAATAGRSWMGPIAGLAAGLGIAALMSHLGLGEAFGNFLMLALLAVAAIFLVRFVMRRMGGGTPARSPALAGAGAPAAASWQAPANSERRGLDLPAIVANAPAAGQPVAAEAPVVEPAPAVTPAFVPASFDSEGFSRIAKMIFIRMQAANDSADLDDLRRFTTPEMFASARLDIQERGPAAQKTDVVHVDAEVLDVASEGDRQIVSVRFSGQIVEEPGAAPVDFNEVWHLAKPLDDSRSWAIAGIEQNH
ncbi:MAG: Tim44-like domain-containing protein [Burkholderiaceae bacterium]|nr:Tim44-like domain-containing protein [Burkholderiaceae bacterium]